MFASPFTWIRSKVRDAVVAGFGDGIAALDGPDSPLDTAIPETLLSRLRLPVAVPALPAASLAPASTPVVESAAPETPPATAPFVEATPPIVTEPAPSPAVEMPEPGRRRKASAA